MIAAPYAPTAMKPAWPTENSPMYPFTRFRLVVRMMLTPTLTSSSWRYGLMISNRGSTQESAKRTASTSGMRQLLRRMAIWSLCPVATGSDLLQGRPAEEAVRTQNQQGKHERKDGQIPVRRRQDGHDEDLDRAQQESAEHGSAHMADTADHRGDERLPAHEHAHVRIDDRIREAVENAGRAAERSA